MSRPVHPACCQTTQGTPRLSLFACCPSFNPQAYSVQQGSLTVFSMSEQAERGVHLPRATQKVGHTIWSYGELRSVQGQNRRAPWSRELGVSGHTEVAGEGAKGQA